MTIAAALLLTGWLAAEAPGEAAGSPDPTVPLVLTAERLALPRLRGPLELRVDALGAAIELQAPRDLGALAAAVARGARNICPSWEVGEGRIVLRCRTRRLRARVTGERKGGQFLDLQELRGLPRDEEVDRLDLFYDPIPAGLGGPCPGTTPGVQAECSLRDGKTDQAEALFRQALVGADQTMAVLRLGDLAAARGDFPGAALMWSRAGSRGPFGRLAATRVCELSGSCLGSKDPGRLFDAGEVAEPMRTELAIRGARAEAFVGRLQAAVLRLRAMVALGSVSGGCVTVGAHMCRRVLQVAVEEGDPEVARLAIEVYLSLPDREEGPDNVTLARIVAERALRLGAPAFAANLQASVAAAVSDKEIPEHLLRTAELYLLSGDGARAQLIADYADSRLTPGQLRSRRWAQVRRTLLEMAQSSPNDLRLARELIEGEAARDLADAMISLSRARTRQP